MSSTRFFEVMTSPAELSGMIVDIRGMELQIDLGLVGASES